MALDKIVIGTRIRRIREEVFNESRCSFGKRCNLTERHIGQIERGEYLISLSALDCISSATGIDLDYFVYGKSENENLKLKQALKTIINRCDQDELKMYYKCITTINGYVKKNEKSV